MNPPIFPCQLSFSGWSNEGGAKAWLLSNHFMSWKSGEIDVRFLCSPTVHPCEVKRGYTSEWTLPLMLLCDLVRNVGNRLKQQKMAEHLY